MGDRRSRSALDKQAERSVGMLWTLQRGESTARCALVAAIDGLQLRVLMDDDVLRSERCESHHAAFEMAERWRMRMTERGWVRVRPQGWTGRSPRLP
jgi:hypothetical protein